MTAGPGGDRGPNFNHFGALWARWRDGVFRSQFPDHLPPRLDCPSRRSERERDGRRPSTRQPPTRPRPEDASSLSAWPL